MRVLVGCEESQEVCKAFRALGHEAYSCDLQACSGGHPEWHIQLDILEVVMGGWFKTQSGEFIHIRKWDLGIFHPPCTYLPSNTSSNAHSGKNDKLTRDPIIASKTFPGIARAMAEQWGGKIN